MTSASASPARSSTVGAPSADHGSRAGLAALCVAVVLECIGAAVIVASLIPGAGDGFDTGLEWLNIALFLVIVATVMLFPFVALVASTVAVVRSRRREGRDGRRILWSSAVALVLAAGWSIAAVAYMSSGSFNP